MTKAIKENKSNIKSQTTFLKLCRTEHWKPIPRLDEFLHYEYEVAYSDEKVVR